LLRCFIPPHVEVVQRLHNKEGSYTWQQIFLQTIPANHGGDRGHCEDSSTCRSCRYHSPLISPSLQQPHQVYIILLLGEGARFPNPENTQITLDNPPLLVHQHARSCSQRGPPSHHTGSYPLSVFSTMLAVFLCATHPSITPAVVL